MKFMKKLAGVLAATALSVGMLAGTGFAEGTTQEMGATTSVTVTVSGVESGDMVAAYKIATVTLDESNQLQVSYADGLPAEYDSIDEIAAVTGDADKLAMANAIAQAIPAGSTAATFTTTGSLQLRPGYYLLRTTATSGKTKVYQFNIVSVWPTIEGGKYVLPTSKTVGIKSEGAPSVTKTINGAASIDNVADGGQVTMAITTAIPSYPKDATNATYVLTDNSTRLWDFTNITVAINGGKTLKEGTDYKLATGGSQLVVTFTESFIKNNPGAQIVITYNTTLAIGDYVDGTAKNEVYGTFNPSPYNAATANTNTATVTAKTYGFYFKKLGANAAETPLAGTVFQVKQGNVVVAERLVADASGYIQLDGLANGTYTLHEVSVGVAGFGTVADFNITLNGTNCTADNPATSAQNETNYLAVSAGKDAAGANAEAGEVFDPVAEVPTLPETGGIGTIVFSVLGVLIMAAAVVLFVRRKQSEK